jgi:Flp pilus assembly protein TadD/tRNA A-37 threonylcarbamoyl transferase component Bud32
MADDGQHGVQHSWLAHEQALQDFEAAWQQSPAPLLEEFLAGAPAPQRSYLLAELIKIDLEHRWKTGRRALVEEYAARFPELSEKGCIPLELLDEEIRVRRDCGQATTKEELVARFPDRRQELEETRGRPDETWPSKKRSGPERLAQTSPAEGGRLGRYELGEELGRGAFAIVHRAWDKELRRDVAIKIPRQELLDSNQLHSRVLREAHSAARLRHPAIVSIHEVVADPDALFIVYEFVGGPTLDAVLHETTPAAQQIAQWAARLADAVDYAHQCGVIHRDIKPANVLMDQGGEPKLTDFGLARQLDAQALLTQEGDLLGTPAYMAPEQVRGESGAIDARTDVYALGVVLYEALAGQLPFAGSGASVFDRILHAEPPAPRAARRTIPADLETICLKAMAKEPNRRYQTAGALADDLRRFLEHRPIQARRIGPAGRIVRWCRRQPAQAALAAALIVLATGAIAGGLWYERARATRTAEIRSGIERAWSEASTLAHEAARLRHQPAEWRALLTSAMQAIDRAEQGAAQDAALVDGDLSRRLAALRMEIDAEERDQQMVARLDDILYHWSDIERGGAGYATVDRLPEYAQAFREYGIPAIEMAPAAASRSIRQRPTVVRERLMAALYAWHGIRSGQPDNPEELAWLGELLVELRLNPWQEKVVTAAAVRDRAALESLAAEADLAAQSPRLLDHLAGALVRENAPTAAVDLLRRSLIYHPSDFWLNHNLASLLASSDRPQIDEAIRYFTAAAAVRPNDAGVLCNLGVQLQRAGRSDEAMLCFRKAIGLNPNLALSYTNLANILWEKGDLDGAIANCREAIAVSPKLPVAHFSLGIALRRKGDLVGAVAAYRAALDLQPDYAEAQVNLGVALQLQGDLSGAIAAYRSAIACDPKFAMASSNLGDALVASGDLAAAVAHFRQAVAVQPDYASAWCGLGLALRDLGEFDESLAALRRGHELGSARNWRQPSAEWVAELERLVNLDQRLSEAKHDPAALSPPELAEFAQLCYYKRQFGQSATFWRRTLAGEQNAAGVAWRYNAACNAALAGSGQGDDDPPLDEIARSAWRQQALEWLTAELAEFKSKLESGDAAARQAVAQTLAQWQTDRDLAGLRDEPALSALAADERAACRNLWAAVSALLAQAGQL